MQTAATAGKILLWKLMINSAWGVAGSCPPQSNRHGSGASARARLGWVNGLRIRGTYGCTSSGIYSNIIPLDACYRSPFGSKRSFFRKKNQPLLVKMESLVSSPDVSYLILLDCRLSPPHFRHSLFLFYVTQYSREGSTDCFRNRGS
jgi:hypothetical protein